MRPTDIQTWCTGATRLGLFPAIASHAVAVVSNPDSSVADLARIVHRHPAVSMRIVRLVNGPFYGLPRPIHRLDDVFVYTGMAEALRLILAVSIGAQLWDSVTGRRTGYHAVRVGGMARLIAKRTAGVDPGDAFLTGCLHDGAMPVFSQTHTGYDAMVAECHGDRLVDAEREALGVDHAALMSTLLLRWGIAPRIATGVRCHHDPVTSATDPLAVVVQVADAIDTAMQSQVPTQEAVGQLVELPASRALEIRAVEIHQWLDTAAGRVRFAG